MKNRKWSRRAALALAASSGLLAVSQSFAQVMSSPAVIWDGAGTPGASGPYVAVANWNPDTVPANTANNFLEINDNGTAIVNTGDAAEGTFLNLGLNTGDTGNLVIHGGTLTLGELRVGGRETIHDNLNDYNNPATSSPVAGGTGTVVQSGGDVIVTYRDASDTEPPIQSTYIGDAGLASGNTASGTYTITGGTLTSGVAADDSIAIGTGSGTVGHFIQSSATSASTVTSTGFVVVARAGAVADYTMSGGMLNVGVGTAASSMALWVGDGASVDGTASVSGTNGTLTQTAGDINVKAAVEIGRRSGTGTYIMSGGTLTNGAEFRIGTTGSGAALQSGTGELDLSGSAIINVGTNLHVGIGAGATANTAQGTVNMTGGTINMNGSGVFLAVGNGQGSKGTFTQTAGTINASTGTTLSIGRNNGMGTFDLNGSNATLNINTLTIDSSSPALASPREFKLENGTANFGSINNGNGIPNSNVTRKFTMTGGTLNVAGTTAGGKAVQWNLSGGDATFGGAITFDTSIVNLTGTNLVSTSLTTGTGQFYYSAGALTASTIFTLSSGGTFETDNDQTLSGVANFNVGTATVNVNSGTLTLPNLLNNTNRTLTKSGPGTLNINGNQANTGVAPTLTVSAGTVNMNSNAAGPSAAGVPGLLVVNANSTTNFSVSQGLANINVGGGAVATLTENATPTTTNKVINTTAVGTISGKLDLTNNKLVTASAIGSVSGATYSGVLGLVQSGRAGGAWTGNGIVTSETAAATPSHLTTLGVASGADVKHISGTTTATWAGQTVHAADTLVMYTYAGDTNLDGKIDADDYFNIDSNYDKDQSTVTYSHGDLNYDGVINGDDYFLMDSNYAAQGSAFASGPSLDAGLSLNAAGVQAVPEPASLALLGLGGMAVMHRRRRHLR